MTPRTHALIERFFSDSQREEAAKLLRDECGTNLPFCDKLDDAGLERYRFAALKLSNGNIVELRRAVRVAQEDWRDLMMAAGFGDSVEEYDRWATEVLGP